MRELLLLLVLVAMVMVLVVVSYGRGCGCGCGGFYLVFPCSGRGAHDIEVGIVQKPL